MRRQDILPTDRWTWAFWRWFDCCDPDGRVVIRRLTVVRTPWFEILFHRLEYETNPLFHTHPWSFISFFLWGSYVEEELDKDGRPRPPRHVRWINVKHATTPHRVISGRAYTLVLATGRWNTCLTMDNPRRRSPQGRCFDVVEVDGGRDKVVGWEDRKPQHEIDFCENCSACLACSEKCTSPFGHFWVQHRAYRVSYTKNEGQ